MRSAGKRCAGGKVVGGVEVIVVGKGITIKDLFMAGYHLRQIDKGILGEISKIREETDELQDAVAQGCTIMALVELSDLYGAIDHYLKKHHPGTTMEDLKIMSYITSRAFLSGRRK